mgnify:CR=1 FL=1
MIKIPQSELEIMKVIWAFKEESVSSKMITTKLEEIKGWKRTTTLTLLSRLVEKGFLEADKTRRLTYYTTNVGEEEYKLFSIKNFAKDVFDKDIEDMNKLKEIAKLIGNN